MFDWAEFSLERRRMLNTNQNFSKHFINGFDDMTSKPSTERGKLRSCSQS